MDWPSREEATAVLLVAGALDTLQFKQVRLDLSAYVLVETADEAAARVLADELVGVHQEAQALRRRMTSRAAKYGMTLADFRRFLDDHHWRCDVCGSTSRLHVDHDHACCRSGSCGRCVRGLLCSACNVVLGMVRDDIDRLRQLSEYLEASRLNGRSKS